MVGKVVVGCAETGEYVIFFFSFFRFPCLRYSRPARSSRAF